METEEILAPVLAALLNSDLIGALFRQVFPSGTSMTVPIDPITVALGPVSATLCPGGCGAKVTIRNLVATADGRSELPIRVRIVLDVSVRSQVGSARAPLPLVTSGGDLAIDIDTTRGATDLKFVMEAIFARTSNETPEGFFRVDTSDLPSAMRFSGVAVDVGEILPVPGFELEAEDLDFQGTSTGGRAAAQVINYYEAAMVPYMRGMIHYSLNTLLCARFGTDCRELVMPEFPDLTPRGSSLVLVAGLATLLLGGAYLWKKRKTSALASLPPMSEDLFRDYRRVTEAGRRAASDFWGSSRYNRGVARGFFKRTKRIDPQDFYDSNEEREYKLDFDATVENLIAGCEVLRQKFSKVKKHQKMLRDVTRNPLFGRMIKDVEDYGDGEDEDDLSRARYNSDELTRAANPGPDQWWWWEHEFCEEETGKCFGSCRDLVGDIDD